MAVVGTAGRQVIIYQLENQPQEFKRIESPLKFQVSKTQRTVVELPVLSLQYLYKSFIRTPVGFSREAIVEAFYFYTILVLMIL